MNATDRRKLTTATERAQRDKVKAEESLAKRDDLAADLADKGASYADLAEVLGITQDGVTYVLRKVRRAREGN